MAEDAKKKVDLFDDEEVSEEEVVEHDENQDLKEGFIAERDPSSKAKAPFEIHKQEADDLVQQGLNKQVTSLGKDAAKQHAEEEKIKLMVPVNEYISEDDYAVVATNGCIYQIKRGVPVMVPKSFFARLSNGGYNPTMVP